ncbi:hypothetical protein GWI33_015374 [Rhynchophorus ferrugineus]|uniref:CCZ1/INTU/HSP4 first Longin domain-containing protein n=1 Tax=Rhynchophorus ferrugineus TaxID=354439 RepID=A0A834HZW1_RHYFE|nr:hypothetical protein GWI33_015374 [Rhynchophorus ferrugineus]
MAKETTIIFVYDTELLKREEDDPNSAILYFYPTWVSEQQKTLLCGQLMGTLNCIRSLFTLPKIVCLQTGKFCFTEDQRYILAIGSDKNTKDWILKHKMDLISSLFKFFHKDFSSLALLYDLEGLRAKLYHIFDVYMKILLFGSNIFTQVFLFNVQKNSNPAVTDASSILEACREFGNTLGGAIMFQNKVVSTQLSSTTTKLLVLSDLFRIKTPADVFKVDFELPEGVQLFQVYISNKEFCDLLENSLQTHYIFQFYRNKNIKKSNIMKKHETDSSLLYTTVPEEEVQSTTDAPKVKPKKPRPKSLNLRSISIESTDSQFSFKTTPMTPFCGQNSMVDTPMTEFKTFIRDDYIENKTEAKSDIQKIVKDDTKEESPNSGSSLNNLLDALNSIDKCPMQYSNQKNKIISSPQKSIKLKRSKSIHDPIYPLFNDNGMAVSGQKSSVRTPKAESVQTITNKQKKSLTLPLKAVTSEDSKRRYSTGVQLTPLMSKLTILAMEDQKYNTKFNINSRRTKNVKDDEEQDRHKCGLFVLGQKDLVLTLLVKEEFANDKETFLKLYDLCKKRLSQLEIKLLSVMESHYDQWDLVKHCGPWDLTDETVLSAVHADFMKETDISEILIRRPESTIYSYHGLSSEVFYHENSQPAQGLPSSADPMGTIQTKAKQRLERDHSIIL